MIVVNLQSVDDLIFANARVRELLQNSFRPIIDQWMISQKLPFLRHLRKQARLDMLHGLNQDHIRLLEEYFNSQVIVEKLDSHVVKNLEFAIDDEIDLCENEGFNEFSIYRNAAKVYISLWR